MLIISLGNGLNCIDDNFLCCSETYAHVNNGYFMNKNTFVY